MKRLGTLGFLCLAMALTVACGGDDDDEDGSGGSAGSGGGASGSGGSGGSTANGVTPCGQFPDQIDSQDLPGGSVLQG